MRQQVSITRTSMITQIKRTAHMLIDPNDFHAYTMNRKTLEEACPYLSEAERRFIKTGIVIDEYKDVPQL